MLPVLSLQAPISNATQVGSMLYMAESFEDITELCQVSIALLKKYFDSESKYHNCLREWRSSDLPHTGIASKKYKVLCEDTVGVRKSQCSRLKESMLKPMDALRDLAKQEVQLTRTQIFPVNICARQNLLRALERRSTFLVINSLFASSLAIHDAMQEVSDVCSSNPDRDYILEYVPPSVLGLSTEIRSEQLGRAQQFFPNLIREMELDIQELRALEKEGEDLLYSTPWLLVKHFVRKIFALM